MGELFNKLIQRLEAKKQEEENFEEKDDALPDYETRDKRLKSLRRFHRKLLDEEEKKAIKQDIAQRLKKKEQALFKSDHVLRHGNMKIKKNKPIMTTKKRKKNQALFITKRKTRRR